jgi:hypothetical protein
MLNHLKTEEKQRALVATLANTASLFLIAPHSTQQVPLLCVPKVLGDSCVQRQVDATVDTAAVVSVGASNKDKFHVTHRPLKKKVMTPAAIAKAAPSANAHCNDDRQKECVEVLKDEEPVMVMALVNSAAPEDSMPVATLVAVTLSSQSSNPLQTVTPTALTANIAAAATSVTATVPLERMGGAAEAVSGNYSLQPGVLQQTHHYQFQPQPQQQQQQQYGYGSPLQLMPLQVMQQPHQFMHPGLHYMQPYPNLGGVQMQIQNGVQPPMYIGGNPPYIQPSTSMYTSNVHQTWLTTNMNHAAATAAVAGGNGSSDMYIQQLLHHLHPNQ